VLGFVTPVAGRAAGYCMVVNSLRRGLKYQSQYEGPAFRLLDRVYMTRRRLGKPGASGDHFQESRWQIYSGLARLLLRLESASSAAMTAHVNVICRRRLNVICRRRRSKLCTLAPSGQ
jgi:hypothetical protein